MGKIYLSQPRKLKATIVAATPKSRANPGPNRSPPALHAALPSRRAEARIQLGARIAEAKYRQLKLAAVLRGVTVQTLVEHAIQEFLTNHPELLHSSLSEHPAKSTARPRR
jgi:hypothetical protein